MLCSSQQNLVDTTKERGQTLNNVEGIQQ